MTIETRLFSPLRIRGVVLRNRVALSPMLTYSAQDGFANERHLVHYGRFAAGGVGLVFLESTKVDPCGRSTPSDLGIWDDRFIEALGRISGTIKLYGAVPGLQLGHSGRKARRAVPWEGGAQLRSHSSSGREWELLAPSAIAHSEAYVTPREMSRHDIGAAIEAWGRAAERALAAGFEVLEIHGAHGYLIHQFLSPAANRRTDDYGGTLENRMRFALDVVRRVRSSWPEAKPLFFRISAEDDAGWTLEDSIALARRLREEGVDVIDCSAGGMLDRPPGDAVPGYGYQASYAGRIKAEAGTSTMAVGLIVHGDQAEEIIGSGAADLVALGRELLHNPNWAFDAAQKLGIPEPFGLLPPNVGLALQKRSRNPLVTPSTWQRGVEASGG